MNLNVIDHICYRRSKKAVYLCTVESSSTCPSPSPAGVAAVPDHPDQPWPDDGGALGQWQDHGLEGAAQGPGEAGGHGGRGPHHRPQGHQQGPPVRHLGPQHPRVDGRPVHTHPQEVSQVMLYFKRHVLSRSTSNYRFTLKDYSGCLIYIWRPRMSIFNDLSICFILYILCIVLDCFYIFNICLLLRMCLWFDARTSPHEL